MNGQKAQSNVIFTHALALLSAAVCVWQPGRGSAVATLALIILASALTIRSA